MQDGIDRILDPMVSEALHTFEMGNRLTLEPARLVALQNFATHSTLKETAAAVNLLPGLLAVYDATVTGQAPEDALRLLSGLQNQLSQTLIPGKLKKRFLSYLQKLKNNNNDQLRQKEVQAWRLEASRPALWPDWTLGPPPPRLPPKKEEEGEERRKRPGPSFAPGRRPVAAGVAGQASSLARGPVSISVNQPGSAASILSAAPPSSTSRDCSLSLLTLVIPNSIAARICVRESKMSVFLATAAAAAAAESVLSGSREASRVFQSSGEVGAGSGRAPSAFLILAQASFASRARRSRLSLSSVRALEEQVRESQTLMAKAHEMAASTRRGFHTALEAVLSRSRERSRPALWPDWTLGPPPPRLPPKKEEEGEERRKQPGPSFAPGRRPMPSVRPSRRRARPCSPRT